MITSLRPLDQVKVPVKKDLIIYIKGRINFDTNNIFLNDLEHKSYTILSLISLPLHIYNSLYLEDGKDEIFNLKLNFNTLCFVHCPSHAIPDLASSMIS